MKPIQLLHTVTDAGHRFFVDGKRVTAEQFRTVKHGKRQDCFFTRATAKAVRNHSTVYP